MERLVIVPTLVEARFLEEAFGLSFVGGDYPTALLSPSTLVVVSGAGKVNAALCTCRMLERYGPVELWVVGVGGAYPGSGFGVGDVVFAEEEVYGDEKFEPLRFGMKVPLEDVPTGVFITVSRMPEDVKEAERLALAYGGAVENMEGAAVAHAASLFGVRPVEVRGISNIAGCREGWSLEAAMGAVVEFIREREVWR